LLAHAERLSAAMRPAFRRARIDGRMIAMPVAPRRSFS
jgi:hypothetical protein